MVRPSSPFHAYGNMFTRNLGAGETIDPELGGFLYKDAYVQRAANKMGVKSYLQKGFCPTPSAHLGGPNARILGSRQLSL